MSDTIFCPFCEKETAFVIQRETESYPVKGEATEIEAQVTYCKECGNDIWNEKLDAQNLELAFEIYRKKHHLLMPAEIKAIRTKYALSQSVFGRALGFGEKTITRYESGSIQDRAQNALMALAADARTMLQLAELNRDLLSPQEFRSIESVCRQSEKQLVPPLVMPGALTPLQYPFAADRTACR